MKRIVAAILLVLYLGVWGLQKNKAQMADYYLSPPLPAAVLKVASGYAQQLTAFSLFIKVAIFAGGPLRGVDKMSYADSMASNFDVMTELHPEFIDSYNYCESFLAPISPEHAGEANKILDRGIAAHPDLLYLEFFKAFNLFYYMNQPAEAAELFYAMARRQDAPEWFAHLAGVLMAKGGNLIAGRAMLMAMYQKEQDKFTKDRYRRAIVNFNKALRVQAALDLFKKESGKDAASLQDLVPRYLESLPPLTDDFTYLWMPPVLSLVRP